MTEPLHPLAAEYLQRLRHDARPLPRETRRELLADIEAHLSEATWPGMADAEVLTVLDRLGDPEEIVAAQSPPPRARSAGGIHEWSAIVLLLFGGFVFGIGWFVGLILLWSSSAWRTVDKWIGTLVLPGGLAGAVYVFLIASVVGGTAHACPSSRLQAISVNAAHQVSAPVHTSALLCSPGTGTAVDILWIVLLAVALVTPILTAIYLARRLRKAAPVAA